MVKRSIALFLMLLGMCCVAGTPVFAQSRVEVRPRGRFDKLTVASKALLVHVEAVCKTEECAALISDTSALVTEAQAKRNKHALAGYELAQFHKTMRKKLSKIQQALFKKMTPEEEEEMLSEMSKPGTPHFVLTQGVDQCAMCDKVFAATSAICGLNVLASPIVMVMCEAAAIYAYNNCLMTNCGPGTGAGSSSGGDVPTCDSDPEGCSANDMPLPD